METMNFLLTNALASFMSLLNGVFKPFLDSFVILIKSITKLLEKVNISVAIVIQIDMKGIFNSHY